MFRDPSDPTNPYAAIKAINRFGWGDNNNSNTHQHVFDQVPTTDGHLERGTDQAAAGASRSLIASYIQHVDESPEQAQLSYHSAAAPYFQSSDAVVFSHQLKLGDGWLGHWTPIIDPAYQSALDSHFSNEICIDPGSQLTTSAGTSIDSPALMSTDLGEHGASVLTSGSSDAAPAGAVDPSTVMSIDPGAHGAPAHTSGSSDAAPAGAVDPSTVMSIDPGAHATPAPGSTGAAPTGGVDPSTVMSIDPG
jgi:hypothetical protein